MAYCDPWWISDYQFSNALRFHLSDAHGVGLPAPPPAAVKALLLCGGVRADSVPFLEPAFVVDAPSQLPQTGGDYRVIGRTEGRTPLFDLTFAIPPTADGDGGSSFAFVLPVRPAWEGNLASTTLSGPGGSGTLDGDTDLPMAIVRDPSTGYVRGILRDVSRPDAAAVPPQADVESLDVLFSRGIPDAAAWSR